MNYLGLIKRIIINRCGVYQRPSFIRYSITWRCNCLCGFCDIWKKNPQENEELSLQDIVKIFRQIRKPDILRISGGEPFMRNDLLEVVNSIDDISAPAMIHISSNGILTEKIIDVMKRLIRPQRVYIKISIDHVGKRHDEIRGVRDAYDGAIRTIKELLVLRKKYKFHIGINQTVVNESDIQAYEQLRSIFRGQEVSLYCNLAIDPVNSLYSDKLITDPGGSVRPFGKFSSKGLESYIRKMIQYVGDNKVFRERVVYRYHLKGLYNRILQAKPYPNPSCVALNNHIRILPNGDVPVCMYNGTIVGNLKNDSLDSIWNSSQVSQQRQWVRNCSGCWQFCESMVNALYTGDIWKGIL